MRSRARWVALVIAALVAGLALYPGVATSDLSRRLAERGPSTLIVGALFAVSAPPALLIEALRGQSLRLSACRLGHGLTMLGASAVVLPASLILAPLYWRHLPGAWLDGVVDAVQEDYCTRPLTAVLP
jgi:hypothetical protein